MFLDERWRKEECFCVSVWQEEVNKYLIICFISSYGYNLIVIKDKRRKEKDKVIDIKEKRIIEKKKVIKIDGASKKYK